MKDILGTFNKEMYIAIISSNLVYSEV